MNAYAKNVLRTIMGNKRRSLLLLLITALGTAFFVGLRSTSPNMNITFDKYFDERTMYDIRVMSTLGLTDSHIQLLRGVDGVERAEPAYSTDLFAKLGDASYLFRFHSAAPPGTEGAMLADTLIIEGRMPELSGECAVSYRFSQLSGCKIGDLLSLSTGDDTVLGDFISNDTYIVTGLVESPLYLLADLGTSGKGSGILQAFAYVPFGDFTQEVYTEAQILLSNPDGYSRFDDRFKDMSAAVEDELQEIGDEFAVDRRRLLMARASAEISSAASGIAQSRDALERAGLELDQAELALEEQARELASGRAGLNASISRERARLNEGDAQLAEARRAAAQGRQEIEAARKELEAARISLDGVPAAVAGESLLRIEQAEKELDIKERELAASEAELAESELELISGTAELDAALYDGLAALAAAESELSSARLQLEENRLAYQARKAEAEPELIAGERDIARARAELKDMPEAKYYVLGLDKNLGFASFEQDSERIDSISRVFPLIFFLVAALVAFTGMVRIVEDDRPTVAAMRSLGYGPGAVAGKYIVYALSVGVSGTVLGIAAGYQLLPAVIFNFGYRIMYLMPEMETPLHLTLCAMAFAISMAGVLIPTIAVSMADVRCSPAFLMRPKAPPPGRRILLERVRPLWASMSFSAKVTSRNILRYKKRFFMTVAGITGCTAVMLTGFGVRDSIKAVASSQFDRIYNFDFQITVSDRIGRADSAALERYLSSQDDVTGWLYQYRENVDASVSGGTVYEATLVVSEDAERLADFVRLADPGTGEPVAPDGGRVVITQKLSYLLGVGTGDRIVLSDEDDVQITAEIGGIAENYVGHYVYMTKEHYAALTGSEPEYRTLLCSGYGLDEAARDRLSGRILENEGVSALSFIAKTRDFYSDLIESLNFVVIILIIAGALLAFVVLFSLTGINIDERKREIATLKVLGFYDGEAAAYIFRENIVNTVVGAASGLALGILLHQFVIRTAEVDMVMFGKAIDPFSYVISAALTFLFMFVVNAAMSGSIRNIDMIESLKSVE